MSTIDPKRAALVKALMERDLYAMLDIPRDADDDEILAAIARHLELVEETPMRHADRQAEMHWLAWAERALVREPEMRTDYDAALAAKAAGEARAVEARQRVRNLRVARDQLARREAGRSVPVEEKKVKKTAATPRRTPSAAPPAGAGPEIEAVIDVRAQTVTVTEDDAGHIALTETVEVIEVDGDEAVERTGATAPQDDPGDL